VVSDYSWATYSTAITEAAAGTFEAPKYNIGGVGNPYAQLDPSADVIPPSAYS